MKLETLKLENFGPYKDEFRDFTKFKSNKVLILGENKDDEGADSNGSGKCCNEHTYIFTSNGIKKIGELVKIKEDETYLQGPKIQTKQDVKDSSIYNSGKIKTIKIKTRLNFELEGGYDKHRIWALDSQGNTKWRYIKNLRLGDYVGISYGFNLYGDHDKIGPYRLDEDLAYFIGALIGDGYIKERNFAITCAKQDEFIVNEINRIMSEKLGIKLNFRSYGNKNNWSCTKSDKKLKELFSYIPEIVAKSYYKRIPKQILRAPQDIQAAFLRGLFDTDGSVDQKRLKVIITQNNLELINEIRMILLNMGIISRYDLKKTSWQNGKGTTDRLSVYSEDAKLFYQLIGFGLKRKNDLLKKHIDHAESLTKRRYNTNYNIIPLQREKFKKIIDQSKNLKFKPMNVYLKTRNPSKSTVKNFLNTHSDVQNLEEWKYINNLIQEKIIWLPITKIKESESQCWDLCVPEEENFISNGFISHNSKIFDAISWVISGKTAKEGKIESDDVIGPFSDETKVTITFTGRFKLKIERTKGNKTSLKFWVNDEKKYVEGNSKKTQVNLLMYLGVSVDFQKNWFDDFMSLTYFSDEVAKVFTNSNSKPAERYAFISRYLSLEILDLCKENTKNKLNDKETLLFKQNSELDLINSRIEGTNSEEELKEQLKILNTLKQQKNQELKSLDSELNKIIETQELKSSIESETDLIKIKSEELENRLTDLKETYKKKLEEYESLKNIDQKIEEIRKTLEAIKIDDLYEKSPIAELNKKNNEESQLNLKYQIDLVKSEIEKLKSYKSQKVECPRCNANLMIIKDKIELLDLSIIDVEINSNEVKKEELLFKYNQLNQDLQEILSLIKEINNEINLYNINKQNLNILETKQDNKEKLLKEINDIVEQKETWETTTKDYIETKKLNLANLVSKLEVLGPSITKKEYDERNLKLNKEIQELIASVERNEYILEKTMEDQDSKNQIKLRIKNLKIEIERVQFSLTAFPIIKKWRIDDFIPSFRLEINNILNRLKSRTRILIDTDSMTKKGTIKDDFPIKATDQYGKTRGLETFSKGEKGRISVAIAWALRNLTKDQNYLPFEFCMMDEVADGLDEKGIGYLSSLIDQTDGQFYVISHFNTFKNQFSDIIRVVKENGQSRIKEE